MYSTCDSKNNDRIGRTESIEDALISPSASVKDHRLPKYSSSKRIDKNRQINIKSIIKFQGITEFSKRKYTLHFVNISGNKSRKNRNSHALSHSASNLLRRSFGRLPFVFSQQSGNTMSLTPYDSRTRQPDDCVEADDRFQPSKSGTKGSLLNVSRTIELNTTQTYGIFFLPSKCFSQ